jgi:class 3 adenylate cyclase/tetratricopeptide (TPR) repeat protein
MQCPHCQTENRPEARFCRKCGARLESTCPNCGVTLEPGGEFCDVCGFNLTAPPRGISPRLPSPESYTPRHLAERILTSRAAVEGERKQVTVLFADLKGSMELLAERDPEDAAMLLEPVLERLMEAVHRYEGTVNQILGDGIMAIFGAPLALEDHALRACYAALTMQGAIRAHSETVRRKHGVTLQIRVGLNSGEVLVRAIGNDLHMDYAAIGQTTHLASRMEQLASPGTIQMTVATQRLVEGYVNVSSLGQVSVKGLADPVATFELLGAEFSKTRLQVARARGLSRFVGRQREIEILGGALQEAGDGHGQIVALVGDPGVGKSRLVWEFIRSEPTAGWLVLESRSVSYGRATAYGPMRDLLKLFFAVEDRDDAAAIRDKVAARVASLDRALEETMPPVLALLGALDEASTFLRFDPPERRRRTLDAMKRLILRESRMRPLLLVFEDLHWIDSETQSFLDTLTESLPAARILMLVNYRPEYQHGWGSRSYYRQLRIDPLAPDSAEELLRALLGSDPDMDALKQLLVERTERNPFFLEESIRTLAETHVLAGEQGAYRLAKPLEVIQIPATVKTVLAARIDRLPMDKKLLLQIASVIGKDVPFDLLEAVAGLSPNEIRSGLAHLQAAEFVYEASLFPELKYTFKHALTLEVTYTGLLQERRRALHAQIVDAMERLPEARLTQEVERLAQHAFRGEAWSKAVRYLRRAGTKASGQSAHRAAVGFFEQALMAIEHLPQTREMLEHGIDLRFDLRNALFALGELDRILDYLHEATSLAETLGDQRRLGWVDAYLTHYFWRVGDHARAIECGHRALAIAEALGDLALETTNDALGRAYYAVGDYPRAIQCLRRTIAAIADDQVQEQFGWAALPAVISRAYLGACLAEIGEFADGIRLGEDAIRIAEAANHPFSLGQALLNLGVLYVRKGDLRLACALLERGPGLSGISKVSALATGISAALGYAYALTGRLADGIPLVEAGVEQAGAKRIAARHSLWVAWLAEAYLLAGRPEDAWRVAERALALSREHNERGNLAYAFRVLGRIAARSRPPQELDAGKFYLSAIALGSELGMRPLVARCRAELGAWYRDAGRGTEAEKELGVAADMFRSMAMTPIGSG